MATSLSSKLKDVLKKYGKVALGVHFSVSAISITSLYIAIKNNADLDSLFSRLHLPSPTSNGQNSRRDEFDEAAGPTRDENEVRPSNHSATSSSSSGDGGGNSSRKNRAAEIAASTGGALGLAILCNKALFPVRVPVTLALTPPIARFLARRKLIKDGIGR